MSERYSDPDCGRSPQPTDPTLTPNPSPFQGEGSQTDRSAGGGAGSPIRGIGDSARGFAVGRAWFAGPLVAIALLALLAAFGGHAHAANVAALEWLQLAVPRAISDPLASLLVLGSTTGSILAVGLTGSILFLRGERRIALALGLLAIGILIELAMKAWLGHPGVPDEYYRKPGWYPVPDLGASDLELPSPFPSGHALRTTFLSLVGVALVARYLPTLATLARTGATLVVALIATLLVVMGWHWITDVVGGVLLGYAVAAPARHLLRSSYPSRRRKTDSV